MNLPNFRFLAVGALAAGLSGHAQSTPDYELPPVNYSATEPRDAVADLRALTEQDTLSIYGDELQVLRGVLDALNVPSASQMLVFSKTSLQRRMIGPTNPRALYFSDTVYVGWVPGGLIEVAAVDPQLGPVFYAFEAHASGDPRSFVRRSDCMQCHGGPFIRDIPSVFVRSVIPGSAGEPLLRHGTRLVDDRTPFMERWGGWYVTGYTGSEDHRGNAWASESGDQLIFPLSKQRPTELSSYFDVSRYLEETSDVVALLVMEHQMAMQNSLTRAAQRCRRILAYQRSLQEGLDMPVTDELVFDSVKSVFASAVEEVVDHLLFRGAAPLPDGVVGEKAFRDTFEQGAPRTRSGRALKDFQLRDRIFENRCSYLIYSESFHAMPELLKHHILDRLHAALHDPNPNGRYAYLETDEKRRIYEILIETHREARARWTNYETPPGGE